MPLNIAGPQGPGRPTLQNGYPSKDFKHVFSTVPNGKQKCALKYDVQRKSFSKQRQVLFSDHSIILPTSTSIYGDLSIIRIPTWITYHFWELSLTPRILGKNGTVSAGWKRELWKQSLYSLPPSISLSLLFYPHSPYWVNAFRVKATSNLVVISTMKNNCSRWNCWHSGGVRRPFEKPCQGPVFVI